MAPSPTIEALYAPEARYLIGGRALHSADPGFADAVAWAYTHGVRPRCLCQPGGLEMYVARLPGGYIVKRMPDTGCHHAAECPSHGLPASATGLAPLLGTAIVEDPATGLVELKLDFALTHHPGPSRLPPGPTLPGPGGQVNSKPPRLALGKLLAYLWDEAGLNTPPPPAEGRRTWATVRRRLLHAAARMRVAGEPLAERLYLPEPFNLEHRDSINSRRLAHWARHRPQPGQPRRLMLVLAEVKTIGPGRYGHLVMLKHLPDQGVVLPDELYRRLVRQFSATLEHWAAQPATRLVACAAVGLQPAGVATAEAVALKGAAEQWGWLEEVAPVLVD